MLQEDSGYDRTLLIGCLLALKSDLLPAIRIFGCTVLQAIATARGIVLSGNLGWRWGGRSASCEHAQQNQWHRYSARK